MTKHQCPITTDPIDTSAIGARFPEDRGEYAGQLIRLFPQESRLIPVGRRRGREHPEPIPRFPGFTPTRADAITKLLP